MSGSARSGGGVGRAKDQARRDVEEAFFLGVLASTGPTDIKCSFFSLDVQHTTQWGQVTV